MMEKQSSAIVTSGVIGAQRPSRSRDEGDGGESSTIVIDDKGDLSVRFGTVAVYEFGMTLDVNPATIQGPAVCLETECQSALPVTSVDEFEKTKFSNDLVGVNLGTALFYLSGLQRKGILLRAGFTERQIQKAGHESRAERLKRCASSCQEGADISFLKSSGFTEEEIRTAQRGVDVGSGNTGGNNNKRSTSKKRIMPSMLRLKSLVTAAGRRASKLPSHRRDGAMSRAA